MGILKRWKADLEHAAIEACNAFHEAHSRLPDVYDPADWKLVWEYGSTAMQRKGWRRPSAADADEMRDAVEEAIRQQDPDWYENERFAEEIDKP